MPRDDLQRAAAEHQRRLEGYAHHLLVCASLGCQGNEAVIGALRQVIAEKGLPFDVKVPNAATQAAMAEARAIGTARFSNADELMRDLEAR